VTAPASVRRALVTGASGGIGSAVVHRLADDGLDVAIHYHTHRERAEALADQLRTRHRDRSFPVWAADLCRPEEVDGLFAALADWTSQLDVLVNGAGINRDRTLQKSDWEEWQSVLTLDLVGPALVSRRATALMAAGGRIINIASIIGFTGNFGQTNYAAAKAGLVGFTKSLARELARRGVTVNAVAPGFIDTPMTAAMPAEARRHWENLTVLGRFGSPEEVAWAVHCLAAPEASYITGTVLHVNGGLY
jgi:3-oxoacyl-[acyl-carrier protein] reductase